MKAGIFTEPTRAATKAERARVRALVNKWRVAYYLNILTIRVHYHDVPMDKEGEDGCAARTEAELADTYHRVTLNIYPSFFTDYDAADQEFVIAHEMAHIIVEPITALVFRQAKGELVTQEELRRADERVTDHVARIATKGTKADQL